MILGLKNRLCAFFQGRCRSPRSRYCLIACSWPCPWSICFGARPLQIFLGPPQSRSTWSWDSAEVGRLFLGLMSLSMARTVLISTCDCICTHQVLCLTLQRKAESCFNPTSWIACRILGRIPCGLGRENRNWWAPKSAKQSPHWFCEHPKSSLRFRDLWRECSHRMGSM